MDNPIDIDIIDQISEYNSTEFQGIVFRATRKNLDPTTPSITGGRWAVRSSENFNGSPVLYTNLDEEGAKAEISYRLALLSPLPSKKICSHKLKVSLKRVITLTYDDLQKLGVNLENYKSIKYGITQKIGSAINFLGFDGLVAPSARWNCNNLMIYTDNHSINDPLDVIETKEFDWQVWAQENGFLK